VFDGKKVTFSFSWHSKGLDLSGREAQEKPERMMPFPVRCVQNGNKKNGKLQIGVSEPTLLH
jgi:hypothetical protein